MNEEDLKLKTPALETLNNGKLTLSTLLKKPNYSVIPFLESVTVLETNSLSELITLASGTNCILSFVSEACYSYSLPLLLKRIY